MPAKPGCRRCGPWRRAAPAAGVEPPALPCSGASRRRGEPTGWTIAWRRFEHMFDRLVHSSARVAQDGETARGPSRSAGHRLTPGSVAVRRELLANVVHVELLDLLDQVLQRRLGERAGLGEDDDTVAD